jgi:hypothetical protein
MMEARNAVYSGKWSEPDDSDLILGMRQVYGNRDRARQFGVEAAERAREFRWEDTIRKLVIVLIQKGFIRSS